MIVVNGVCADSNSTKGADLSKSDNRAKAIAMLKSLASRDRKVVEQVIDPTTYTQRNPDEHWDVIQENRDGRC